MPHRPAENRLPPRKNLSFDHRNDEYHSGGFTHGVIAWIILVAGLVGWGLWVAS